ncbi:hypothetical protein N7495_005573 [Penicillium taxi]|uniref:uncharacterized protein n=1 Tax=Penicillium taxi TaxID=168475 RepID=UPI00254563F2|nr:uncharacterized protein N7495_005573 [Penicillium taxi]KAJ5893882.1 hypothetical protein N7495_005573 [Penicillium taxi]
MDQEEAPPPPYSAVDPMIDGAPQAPTPLRGTSSASPSGSSRTEETSSTSSRVVPIHFTSAAAYFEQRPPPVSDDSRSLLHHHVTIYPRSQAKDFPRRPRCWASRMEEVAQQDWDTFLRYMFPPHLGLAATSQHLPRQLRAEIQRDRKDRPQETDEQRQSRISAVVEEWNQCFFEPRSTCINFIYIGEPDAAPASALCPRCYPAATKATQGTSTPSTEGQYMRDPNTPSPLPGQYAQVPSPAPWPMPPFPSFPQSQYPPMPYGPYGVPQFPSPGVPPLNNHPPQYYPPPPPPPSGAPPWQYNNWVYSQPQFGPSGTSKSGALGWFSNITAQAQKYGERFAEQAQYYGDQISAQAMAYGRQVEEQALAHGRWVEEQARLQGRKPTPYQATTYPGQAAWAPAQTVGVIKDMPPPTNSTSPMNQVSTPSETRTESHTEPQPQNQDKDKEHPHPELTRRASVSSLSSDASLSSFNSLSATSDLSATDLAAVRTQLESLDECHDRTLYDAALDLRKQLDVLQESRHAARHSGRWTLHQDWRRQVHSQSQRTDDSDWGRWDSPQQQQRLAAKRQAMKEEMNSTKKAFRDVIRRAREEQREKRKAHKRRHRHHRHSPSRPAQESEATDESLNRQMRDLTLGNIPDSGAAGTLRTGPTGPVQSANVLSSQNTPSDSQASTSQLPDRLVKPQSRFKGILKPRASKK